MLVLLTLDSKKHQICPGAVSFWNGYAGLMDLNGFHGERCGTHLIRDIIEFDIFCVLTEVYT